MKGGRILRNLTFELHYRITERGVEAFQAYLRELRDLLADLAAPENAGDALRLEGI